VLRQRILLLAANTQIRLACRWFMLLEPVDPNERFRSRRRQARRRRAIRRTAALAVVALAAAGTTLGARFLTERDAQVPVARRQTPPTQRRRHSRNPSHAPYPDEIRGVHVTMALASVPGKIDQYLSLTKHGLNTLELDVKDENGEVGFRKPKVRAGARGRRGEGLLRPGRGRQKAHAAGVYLIGRIVCFEDPVLTQNAPRYAIRTTSAASGRRLPGSAGRIPMTSASGLQRPARHWQRRGPASMRSSSTTSASHRRRSLAAGLPGEDATVKRRLVITSFASTPASGSSRSGVRVSATCSG
jgi:hypothetical protein